MPTPGPATIPPPPSRPKIEGDVESVSPADILEVIRLKQQDMVKEFGRPLPIYTVRVHNKSHIEVQFWEPDGVEVWRDARRVKGKWKFDKLVDIILTDAAIIHKRDLTNRSSQPPAVPMSSFQMTSTLSCAAKLAVASGG